MMPVFYLSPHFLWEQETKQLRSDEKRKRGSDRGHDGGGEDTGGGRNGLNQYHESTGIWNGAQGQFRSSISAADCMSHPRGKASQGCSTTALNKSIVLHFVCVSVCVCSSNGGGRKVGWGCCVCYLPQAQHPLTERAKWNVGWENCTNKEIVMGAVG